MPPHVFPSEYLFSGCFGELLTADDSLAFLLAMGRQPKATMRSMRCLSASNDDP